jgi:ketosteroid isomerase-like protein
MVRASFFTIAILLIIVALRSTSHKSASASGADPSVLMKADQEFDAATAARGIEGFASFIAEDMTTIQPNVPIVRGKESFISGWKTILATPGLSLRWQPQLAGISDDGTLGFTVGTYTTTRTENGSSRVIGSGKYVTIWRKQADGSWKVTFDSGAHDTPPAAPPKP